MLRIEPASCSHMNLVSSDLVFQQRAWLFPYSSPEFPFLNSVWAISFGALVASAR